MLFSGDWVELDLEGNMLHQDEWSMSSAPPHFPLLSVLLRSLLVQAMSHYLNTMYLPLFIHAHLSHFTSKSRSVGCIQISRHKVMFHQSYKTNQDLRDPREPSRI